MATHVLTWLCVLFILEVLAEAQDDEITKPGAGGMDVVDAVIGRIQYYCIFPGDHLMMRRMAYVESMDGLQADIHAPEYNGGIWKVDEEMYKVTESGEFEKEMSAELLSIKTNLGVDWSATSWEDLRKPLFSGIGAWLYITYQSKKADVPLDITEQAMFWRTYYRPGGDVDNFIYEAGKLENGCSTTNGADIMLLLDGSGSINIADFYNDVLPFVQTFVKGFDIGTEVDKARVGVIQFADRARVEFTMEEHTDAQKLVEAIGDIVYISGQSNTSDALDLMVNTGFANPRKDHPMVGIILTDGESVNRTATIEKAMEVHAAYISMFTIAVGDFDADGEELTAIASDPTCQHKFIMNDFDDIQLQLIKDVINKKTCDAPLMIDGGKELRLMIQPSVNVNCKINIASNGTTVKVDSNPGDAYLYVAKDRYPSSDYYEQKTDTLSNGNGVIFLEKDQQEMVYCNIEGADKEDNFIIIGGDLGDTDWCQNNHCQNGGSCLDMGDGVACECPKNYFGEECEDYGYNCDDRNPCNDPENIGHYFAHENVYNFLWCGQGLTCNIEECPPDTIWDDEWKTCEKENVKQAGH